MSGQENQSSKSHMPKDRFEAEFAALPLDQKFARLFKMEAATLTETVEYVFNSPLEVVDKVGDALQQFASKVEAEVRSAARTAKESACATPNQAAEGESQKASPDGDKPKGRRGGKRTPPRP